MVLDEEDEGKTDGPVAEQTDKIAHDGGEMVFASDGEDGDDQNDKERPDETRHGVEVVAEELQGEAARVANSYIIAEDGEHEQDKAELGPTKGVVNFSDEATEAVVLVRVVVRRVTHAHGGVAQAGADDGNEGGWEDDPKQGQKEDFPRRCLGRVVAVVVGCDRAPS